MIKDTKHQRASNKITNMLLDEEKKNFIEEEEKIPSNGIPYELPQLKIEDLVYL